MKDNLRSQALISESSLDITPFFRLWLNTLNQKNMTVAKTIFISNENGLISDMELKVPFKGDETFQLFLEVTWNRFENNVADSYETRTFIHEANPYTVSLCPLYIADKFAGLLGNVQVGDKDSDRLLLQSLSLSLSTYMELEYEKMNREHLLWQTKMLESALHKKDSLFEVTERLHSKIDVDSVLVEVIDSIKQVYPAIEIDLYLSQDNTSTLPVQLLSFQNGTHDICTKAFMEGKAVLQTSDGSQNSSHVLAAPLSGKQGVYGVVYLRSRTEPLQELDVQFFMRLIGTAGSAFENAKLYEQSNLLIHELRLINEITKQLNQSLKLSDIFSYASSELIHIFGADFSCILELDHHNDKMIVQASNLPSMFNEDFSIDYGFSGIVYQTKEPIIISDYWSNPKVKSKLMEITNSRSLIASPILVNGEVVGVILVVHRKPNFFSYDNYKLLQVLCVHIGLAMANASLHSEVRRMVITDNLTGLYARAYLDEQVNVLQKRDACGSLIVVDIDHFKMVNDTYGHQIGDKILIHVSNIIKSCIREGDIASRWGGEELAVYLPQVNIDQAIRIAERIRSRVVDETNPRVSVSCGVSDWNWEDEKISVESLFYKADMALYEAKNDGRNCVKVRK